MSVIVAHRLPVCILPMEDSSGFLLGVGVGCKQVTACHARIASGNGILVEEDYGRNSLFHGLQCSRHPCCTAADNDQVCGFFQHG